MFVSRRDLEAEDRRELLSQMFVSSRRDLDAEDRRDLLSQMFVNSRRDLLSNLFVNSARRELLADLIGGIQRDQSTDRRDLSMFVNSA